MADLLAALQHRHPSAAAVRSLGLFGVIEPVRTRTTNTPMAPFHGTSPQLAAPGTLSPPQRLFTVVRRSCFCTDPPLSATRRGQHPRQRSFIIGGTSVVVMGWPIKNGDYRPSLDSLRRAFNTANVLHKYHAAAEDIDNDLFFVLGTIDREKIGDPALERA